LIVQLAFAAEIFIANIHLLQSICYVAMGKLPKIARLKTKHQKLKKSIYKNNKRGVSMTKQERKLITKYNKLSKKWACMNAKMSEIMWVRHNESTVSRLIREA